MPYRLHKTNPMRSSDCGRCGTALGDFSHIFWTCPYIGGCWLEVVALLNSILYTPMLVSMSVCLLGLVKDILPVEWTFANITLFYAWKDIALYWRKPFPPTFLYWLIPVYHYNRDTYVNRGCPHRYEKFLGQVVGGALDGLRQQYSFLISNIKFLIWYWYIYCQKDYWGYDLLKIYMSWQIMWWLKGPML